MTVTPARRAATAGAVALLATTLTACGAADDPATTPGPTSTAPATASPTPPPTPEPTPSRAPAPAPEPETDLGAFSAPGTELASDGDASGYVVTEVRTGEHDGYDRVVYQLEGGQGVPGYRVGYVEQAVEDPSGEVRQVDGDAILQVWLVGTTYPTESGPQEHSQDLRPADGDVEHVVRPLTFEGMTQSFVGVDDGPREFRVTVLGDPARVVVDLQDD
ncbi:conserved hypothetical protein [Cellulomonas flavigena DSM 20109]|uniref:AMIN-like domain-containing protein n=1 Tax=Cellulomonas flavigena (strain ATCC 482 / DSM 20109 / BCRC 11376 / JCM 18109 / NBRC 3775 / NCIMB 8073 / NRS 134) TaxID=446466 RepID=D5ULM4_CELFN|nr:hypothetical protein [Cellulomonas flavigena]ADG74066.1 conserved hypothetical protein [Cellulomonas flavigena DSM 20109]